MLNESTQTLSSRTVKNDDAAEVQSVTRMTHDRLSADVAAVDRLDVVHTSLKVLHRATGLRIALVARVTESSWTACAVLDELGFGLKAGDNLELSTTY